MLEPLAAIAARLGMTPESLSRVTHGLEAAGLVRLQGRRVEEPDAKAVTQAARASGHKSKRLGFPEMEDCPWPACLI